MAKIIQIKNLTYSFDSNVLFQDFSAQINAHDRIAIIGKNGSGKSTLLKCLLSLNKAESGAIIFHDMKVSYIEQNVEEFSELSGAQRFNKRFSQAISKNPDMLFLDEPTNHLDKDNRKNLFNFFKHSKVGLVVATHDLDLIRQFNIFWHIYNGKVHVFKGNYYDYMNILNEEKNSLQSEKSRLSNEQKIKHKKYIQAEEKIAQSKNIGLNKLKKGSVSNMQADFIGHKAQKSQAKILDVSNKRKEELQDRLNNLYIPKEIKYKFDISHQYSNTHTLLEIQNANIGYFNKQILFNINLSICAKDRIRIIGSNGAGKSTFFKGLMNDASIIRNGEWKYAYGVFENIAYFDQHYSELNTDLTVLDYILQFAKHYDSAQIYDHLNTFLFQKELVHTKTVNLSCGQKARLLLAKIGLTNPSILILDEVSNNLDIETKAHIVEVLKNYQGALLVISHEENFSQDLSLDKEIDVKHWRADFQNFR